MDIIMKKNVITTSKLMLMCLLLISCEQKVEQEVSTSMYNKGLYILETEYCHLRTVDEGEYKYIDSIIPIRKKQIIIQENQYLKLIEKTEN